MSSSGKRPAKRPLTKEEKDERAKKSIATIAAGGAYSGKFNPLDMKRKPKKELPAPTKEDSPDGSPPTKPGRRRAPKTVDKPVDSDDDDGEDEKPAKTTGKRPATDEPAPDKPSKKKAPVDKTTEPTAKMPKTTRTKKSAVNDGEDKPKKRPGKRAADDEPEAEKPSKKTSLGKKAAPSADEPALPKKVEPKAKPDITAQHATKAQEYRNLLLDFQDDIQTEEETAQGDEFSGKEGIWKNALACIDGAAGKLKKIVEAAAKEGATKGDGRGDDDDDGDDGKGDGRDARDDNGGGGDSKADGSDREAGGESGKASEANGDREETDAARSLTDAVEDAGAPDAASNEADAAPVASSSEDSPALRKTSEVVRELVGHAAALVGLGEPEGRAAPSADNQDGAGAADASEGKIASIDSTEYDAEQDLPAAYDPMESYDASETVGEGPYDPEQDVPAAYDPTEASTAYEDAIDGSRDEPEMSTVDDKAAQDLQDKVQAVAAAVNAKQPDFITPDGNPSVTGQHFTNQNYPHYPATAPGSGQL